MTVYGVYEGIILIAIFRNKHDANDYAYEDGLEVVPITDSAKLFGEE